MNIIIRRAVCTDAAEMIAFLKQIGGETDNLSFGSEGLAITEQAESAYISLSENSKDNILLVAVDGERIVGTASLNRLPRRMSHRGEVSVSIAKEYWNKGIGGKLLCEIIAFAKENSFEIVELQVGSDNFAAIHLYEKFGFSKMGTYSKFLKIGERYADFDYMYLQL